jgi:DNA ligase-associated metallophosphoesterase
MLQIEVAGVRLGLLSQRAALLVDAGCLLVADAHLGKAVSFRRLGVPVPRGTTTQTLQRLSEAIELSGASRVVFLGDLLHSAHAHAPATLQALAQWRHRHAAVELLLVRGNHDDRAGDPPAELGMVVVNEPLTLSGLALCHHPLPRRGAYVLAGHLHPCATLGGRAHQRLRLPCFHFGAAVGVLPAFGAFTGMHAVKPQPGDRIFLVGDGAVVAHPTLAA